MSQENLRVSLTPRIFEPKCDNEDLRMISEGADGNDNEFDSKVAGLGQDTLADAAAHGTNIEIANKLAAVQRLDNPKVGQVELSVSHHGSQGAVAVEGKDTMKPPMVTGHFKKRLLSAGVRNRVIVGAS